MLPVIKHMGNEFLDFEGNGGKNKFPPRGLNVNKRHELKNEGFEMSRLGFFLFAGLVGGALVANEIFGLPSIGAVAGGGLGAILGYFLDKKSGDQD
jgi:hypothetical protein